MRTSSDARPPRRAEQLLERIVEPAEVPTLLADLDEGFTRRCRVDSSVRARRWYWRQTLILTVAFAGIRIRNVFTSGALLLDTRRAVRSLRRSPGLTLAAVATLGLGMSAPSAAFGIISAMFSPLPVEEPDRVVAVDLLDRESGRTFAASGSVYSAWRARPDGFEALGAYDDHDQAVSGPGFSPVRVPSVQVTPGVLEVLRVEPVLGRTLTESDAAPGAPRAALIREDLWDDWFDRRPDALGAEITMGPDVFTVVGIMPASFGFPEAHQVWTALRSPIDDDARIDVIGRLADGRSIEAVENRLIGSLGALGDSTIDPAHTSVEVEEFVVAQQGRRTLTLLWGLNLLVGLLVVIAAANVSALFLARGLTRTSETALRMSTGGGRWAVIRPLGIEAFIVSALGAGIGVFGAQAIVGWMGATLEARGTLPYWADLEPSPGLLAFALTLLLGATVVAGVIPAIRTTRVDLADALKRDSRGASIDRAPLLSTLVGVEVALACILLVTSTVAVRGALGTIQRAGAFPTEGVLTAELFLEPYAYRDTAARRAFWSGLKERLDGEPGVAAHTLASAMPGDGTSDAWIAIEGTSWDRAEEWPRSQRRVVETGFFDMFDMEISAGRAFTDADGPDSPRVAVVNDAWVDEQLGGASPLGLVVHVRERGEDPVPYEIVGQVRDEGVSVDDGEQVAALFLPVAQRDPERLRIAVKSRPGAPAPLETLTAAVSSIDATLPLDRVMTLEALVRRENDGGRVMGLLFGSLGLAALLLAIVGLHGVVAFSTSQRRHAIGVMRALGATETSVLADVLGRGLRPVGIGLAAGLAVSWSLTPVVSRELLAEAEARAHDPLVFGLVPLLLLTGAVLAVVRPALSASRVDPVAALKAE